MVCPLNGDRNTRQRKKSQNGRDIVLSSQVKYLISISYAIRHEICLLMVTNPVSMKQFYVARKFFSGNLNGNLKRFILIIAAGWVCSPHGIAQSYYPGGLGNSNLLLWLNANKSSSITQNGSNQVSQWSDLSGNGYHFTQGTNGNKPVYGTAASPTSKPALTFTSTSSQYLSIASLPSTISFTAGVSSFAVASYSAPQTTQGWQRIFDFGNGTGSNNFMMGRNGNSANAYYEAWNGGSGDQTYTSSSPIVNLSENIYEAVQQAGTAGSLSNVAHYLAGATQTATGQAGSSKTYVPNSIARTSNYIGRSNWALDNYFSGTMSEILIYNTAFNTTQRVIMENYVSAEWNQTVSVSKYTPPTTTTYTTNLVGIGYTSATDYFLADSAGSTDGLGFSSGSTATDFLNTTGYVMAAHNAQSNTVITNATIPRITSASPLNLWNRSWNVQKTGGNTAGAVTLNFNFSDYNGSTPTATNTFALLYNATDGSFAGGTNQLVTTTSTTVSGKIVSFTLTASNLSAGYYTIIYSASPIALPVTLTGFTATKEGSNSLLEWSIAKTSDLSGIDIQRSTDGAHFLTIGTEASAAYSTTSGQYTFTDSNPLPGVNYYRLVITAQDGALSYSPVRSVIFDAGGNADISLHVYPNPVSDRLHLSFANLSGTVSIRLIDVRGQVLRMMTTAAASADMSVNDFPKGVYVVEIIGTNGKYSREILKN